MDFQTLTLTMNLSKGLEAEEDFMRYKIGFHSNVSWDSSSFLSSRPQLSGLERFGSKYMEIHGILSLIVCAFGIPMNILNVFVLTRQHMHTPVNTLLTWLAVFDLLTMASYLPFSLHFYCFESTWHISPQRNSFGWMTFLIFHIDFTSTTHTISNWLAVTLAIFRYRHIFLPAKGDLTRMRRLVRARLAVFSVVILSVIIMTPNYLMNRLVDFTYLDDANNETLVIYSLEPLNLGTPEVQLIAQINLWIYSTLGKIVPCILMVIFCGLLLKTLRTNVKMIARHSLSLPGTMKYQMSEEHIDMSPDYIRKSTFQKRQRNRKTAHFCKLEPQTSFSSISPVPATKSRRPQDNARTTRMLLAILILYVVTELPQALLIILSASISNFFTNVYIPLGDILDLLPLINNGINFVLYCAMSRDFRETLLSLFKGLKVNKGPQKPACPKKQPISSNTVSLV